MCRPFVGWSDFTTWQCDICLMWNSVPPPFPEVKMCIHCARVKYLNKEECKDV